MASIVVSRRDAGLITRTTTDRVLLREFLEQDRLFAAYAICDLDDREFSRTRWGGAFVGTDLVAVALEYAGLSPQPLFVMGRNDGIEATLRDLVKPRAAYVAALPAALPAVESSYRVDPGPQMVRMWVDRQRGLPRGPGEWPARGRGGHPCRQLVVPPRGRRQRVDPGGIPRPGVRHRHDRRGHRRAAPLLRPGRPQCAGG